MSYIYLASPYTHEDPAVISGRYTQTMEFFVKKFREGHMIFSPIIHCHHASKNYDLPGDLDFWREYNLTMLRPTKELWVLKLPGWEESKGVTWETNEAKMLDIPIEFHDPIKHPNQKGLWHDDTA